MLPTVQVAVTVRLKHMLLNMATAGLGCARCGFMITAQSIAEGLPPGADGTPDVDWVVAALPRLMERARREGKAFLCEDCADESGSAVSDAALLVDLYGTYF
jgi:hypothetical protein